MSKRVGVFLGAAVVFLVLFFLWSIYWGINSKNFSLIFNPHQITQVNPLYYIKTYREFLQSKFVFGDQDLSYRNFTLASKRLVEAQILANHQLKKPELVELKIAQDFQNQGHNYLKNLINVIDVNYLLKMQSDNQKIIDQLNANF